jgi:glycosyltransferase involved in cell wall biosynthesis
MRILCLTDFTIAPGHRWFWSYIPGNNDEITFLHTYTTDKYKKWGKFISSYPRYLQLAWRALREVQTKQYDLVVAWESDTGLPFALVKKLTSLVKPPLVVLTLSIRGPLAHFPGILRYTAQGVDYMTVPTCFEQGYYAKLLNFPLKKIFYCPYGTYDAFQGLQESESDSFVFAGGRSERDYKTLFQAISTLNIPFVVNARPFNLKGLDTPANVTVNNILPVNQFRDLNWCSKFVVVPVENVGQAAGISSVLYAMAAGKAVIASDVPGLHDYITNDVTGIFVPPGDAEKLRQAIQFLWDTPEFARKLGKNARDVYLQNYTFESMARRIVRTLQIIGAR